MFKKIIISYFIIAALGVILSAQTRGTPNQLRVKVDATGALVSSSVAVTNPVTAVQFNNARLALDASGNLLVTDGSGAGFAPADATYITETTSSGLSAEFALASLSTGLLVNTTTTGIPTVVANVAANQILTSGTPPAYSATPRITAIGLGAAAPAAGLSFANGSVFTDSALGTVAMISSATTNSIRVPNGSNAEYNTIQWTSNTAEIGNVTNGGTIRNTRILAGISGTVILQAGGADNWIFGAATATKIAGLTTVGRGTPAIVAVGRVTAQSAANASISTFTVGAADGSFEISANMNVTVVTTLVTTLTCTYTDESNTARTMIFPIQQLAGTFVSAGAITGAGAWESPVLHIRAKAATAITILTSTGTFTNVTYTAEGIIKQIS